MNLNSIRSSGAHGGEEGDLQAGRRRLPEAPQAQRVHADAQDLRDRQAERRWRGLSGADAELQGTHDAVPVVGTSRTAAGNANEHFGLGRRLAVAFKVPDQPDEIRQSLSSFTSVSACRRVT